MNREQLTGAIAALERRPYSRASVAYLLNEYRAQLAALPPEPAQPWTERERRLREALEKMPCWCVLPIPPNKKPCRRCRALAEAPPPDLASVESTMSAVRRDDAERAIKRLHGPAKPDPRDEALEAAEKWVSEAMLDAIEGRRPNLLDGKDVLAAIRAAREGK